LYSSGTSECRDRDRQASGSRVDWAGAVTRGRSGILNLGRIMV
jgi:hypothetical protein